MINAKAEFLGHVKGHLVEAAVIILGDLYYTKDCKTYILPPNYTDAGWQNFLNSINFDYGNGYGSRELFGNIWYVEGTWSDRKEYDGSEWWEHQQRPKYPKEWENK